MARCNRTRERDVPRDIGAHALDDLHPLRVPRLQLLQRWCAARVARARVHEGGRVRLEDARREVQSCISRTPNQLWRVEKKTYRGTIPIPLLAPVTRYTVDEEVAIDVELGSKRGTWSVKLKSNDPHRRRTLAGLYIRVQLASIVYIVLRSPVGTHAS